MSGENTTIRIKIEDTVPLICEECGHDVFTPALIIRKIPRLLIGAPKDEIKEFPVFACINCGCVNEDMRPIPSNKAPVIQIPG